MRNISKYIVLFQILLVTNCLAQSKGATPLQISNVQKSTSLTRAVIVGISDYQSPQIPDLKYADKDAYAFADWLKSAAGGNITDDNIQLLTNNKATRAQFDAALSWLIDDSKEGDEAIIYFSGHGDVETKTKFNRGFLLCYDTPPNNYPAGAYHLMYLQDVITTLSEAKVKTIVISDACHSGKLAGSSVNGSQATSANLAKQFANETKILSCQPNEFSIEGSQWGGGRGVFSYHLVNGLYGLADENHDGVVNLYEIGRYLQDKVKADVAPASQIPIIIGNYNENICTINKEQLALVVSQKSSRNNQLSPIEMKGIEDEILAKVDSLIRKNYYAFKAALTTKNFFDSTNTSAEFLFNQLILIPELKPLYGSMRRNYAAGLQDEVQQAINALLNDDPFEVSIWYSSPEKYRHYPKYLNRAIELLGKEHYSYPMLFAQLMYYEAYLLTNAEVTKVSSKELKDSILFLSKSKLLEATNLSPGSAYIYHAIANLYAHTNPYASDSLFKYCYIAIELAPNWLLPYFDIGGEYLNAQSDIKSAEKIFLKALKIKPDSYFLNELYSWSLQKKGRWKEADSVSRIMINMKPEVFNAWATMTQTHAEIQDWENTLIYARKSLDISSAVGNWSWAHYITALFETRQEKKGLEEIQKAPFSNEVRLWLLSNHYFNLNNLNEANKYLSKLNNSTFLPLDWMAAVYQMEAIISMRRKKYEIAKLLLRKAIDADPTPDIIDCTGRAWLGKVESELGHYKIADSFFIASLKVNTTDNLFHWGHYEAHNLYGDFLLSRDRDFEAKQQFEYALNYTPFGYGSWLGMAKYYAKKGDKKSALDNLEKALIHYYPIPEPILEEPLFNKIKNTKRFKELMKKNFGGS